MSNWTSVLIVNKYASNPWLSQEGLKQYLKTTQNFDVSGTTETLWENELELFKSSDFTRLLTGFEFSLRTCIMIRPPISMLIKHNSNLYFEDEYTKLDIFRREYNKIDIFHITWKWPKIHVSS